MEIGNAGGRFDAKNNIIFIKALANDELQRHMSIHEIYHLKDALEYKEKFGYIESNEELINYNCKRGKKQLDKLGISGDTVGSISPYAYKSYYNKRYDEVYTEYRTKKILRSIKKG